MMRQIISAMTRPFYSHEQKITIIAQSQNAYSSSVATALLQLLQKSHRNLD